MENLRKLVLASLVWGKILFEALQKSCLSKENRIRLYVCIWSLCFHLRSHSCAALGHAVLQILHSSFLKLLFLSSIPRICIFIQQQREPELQSQTIIIRQNSLAKLKGGKDRGRDREGERERDAIQITYRNNQHGFSPGLQEHKRSYFTPTTFLLSSRTGMCTTSSDSLHL